MEPKPSEARSGTSWRSRASRRVVAACLGLLLMTSCERSPSKSDYVSARVSERCADLETTEALQACRLAVITELQDVPFEELKRRYPPPEPRPRPSCTL
jgi:hypothetical protein